MTKIMWIRKAWEKKRLSTLDPNDRFPMVVSTLFGQGFKDGRVTSKFQEAQKVIFADKLNLFNCIKKGS